MMEEAEKLGLRGITALKNDGWLGVHPNGTYYEWTLKARYWVPLRRCHRLTIKDAKAGGRARADALSATRRSEIASNAARARWATVD